MSSDPKKIRNTAILGHSHSGKTMLVEALLADAGVIPKIGSIKTGSTVSDYNEDEKERKISINSSISYLEKDGVKINLIDTPGYNDFIGEVHGALRAAESVCLVVNAVSGVEMGTDILYKLVKSKGLPACIFINKMDKEHADFSKCIEQINKKFGKHCSCVTYPIGSADDFKGVANILTKEGFEGLSDEDKEEVQVLSESLAEAVAESDDALLEKYLEKGELSAEELKNAFGKAVAEGKVIPVFAGSAEKNLGIKELLDFMINAFPDATTSRIKAKDTQTNEDKELKIDVSAPFAGQVFKTIYDTYLGHITAVKIFSGSITHNSSFYNQGKQSKEKVSQIFFLNGKKEVQVDRASAGDIICMAKLKNTLTGDTVCDEKHITQIEDLVFPEPAISFSIKPKTRNDEDKISNALHKLTAEDNTFVIKRDAQTRELIASGMGDLHLTIMINRLRNRFGVQVEIGTPKVAYKETISGKGDAQCRHKKQSGGAGQFAEVWLKVEPLPRGTGFEFVNEVVGGSIPAQFVVSCEKGIRAALNEGFIAGSPTVDVRAIVYDGKTHPVDSKDIAFQIAARHAFKEACQKAKPIILEPIMDVDVIVPDEYMGDVTGSLNQRRGRIMGVEPGEGVQTIKAKVPLEEMYKYVNELKSITQGRGMYNMRFSHYEVVPSNIMQDIIASSQKQKEAEKSK